MHYSENVNCTHWQQSDHHGCVYAMVTAQFGLSHPKAPREGTACPVCPRRSVQGPAEGQRASDLLWNFAPAQLSGRQSRNTSCLSLYFGNRHS